MPARMPYISRLLCDVGAKISSLQKIEEYQSKESGDFSRRMPCSVSDVRRHSLYSDLGVNATLGE